MTKAERNNMHKFTDSEKFLLNLTAKYGGHYRLLGIYASHNVRYSVQMLRKIRGKMWIGQAPIFLRFEESA